MCNLGVQYLEKGGVLLENAEGDFDAPVDTNLAGVVVVVEVVGVAVVVIVGGQVVLPHVADQIVVNVRLPPRLPHADLPTALLKAVRSPPPLSLLLL